jgi:hypothetical protein
MWKQIAGGQFAINILNKLGSSALNIVGSFLDVARETENYEVRLKTLLGSQEAASDAMDFFQRTAAKVPFTLQAVVESGTTLSAMGASFEKWTPVLADLSGVMGIEMPEAANALGRAFAGGAGAADVFRERGILQIVKDSALMKHGIEDISKLTIPEFRDVMFDAFTDPKGRVAGAAGDLAGTWDGMISMLQDAWFQFRTAVMDAGIFDMLKDGLQSVLNWVSQNQEKIKEWARDVAVSVQNAIKFIISVGKTIGKIISAIDKFTLRISHTNKEFRKFLKEQQASKGILQGGINIIELRAAAIDKEIVSVQEWGKKWQKNGRDNKKLMQSIASGKEGKELKKLHDDLIEKLEKQKKKTEELGKSTGSKLVPAYKKAAKEQKTWIDFLKSQGLTSLDQNQKRVKELKKFIEELGTALKLGKVDYVTYTTAVTTANKEIEELSETLTLTAIPAVRDMSGVMGLAVDEMQDRLDGFTVEKKVEEIKGHWKSLADGMGDSFATGLDLMLTKGGSFRDEIGSIWKGMKDTFKGILVDMARDFVVKFVTKLITGAVTAGTSMVTSIGGALGTIGTATTGIAAGLATLVTTLATAVATAATTIAAAAPAIAVAGALALGLVGGFKLLGSIFKKKGGGGEGIKGILIKSLQRLEDIDGFNKNDLRSVVLQQGWGVFIPALVEKTDKVNRSVRSIQSVNKKILSVQEKMLANSDKMLTVFQNAKFAAKGINQIVNRPTIIGVGEGNRPERVTVTPLNSSTLEDQSGTGGNGNINMNIDININAEFPDEVSANQIVRNKILPELIEALKSNRNKTLFKEVLGVN